LRNFIRVFTKKTEGGKGMQKWQCTVCGYIYDPEVGDSERSIPPGVAFEDLPADWTCPVCGAAKDMFEPVKE
jgi:rubredoxin